MAAHQPAIVQGQDDGQRTAEKTQRIRIEVPAMEIVALQDVRPLGSKFEQSAAGGKAEILDSPRPIPGCHGAPDGAQHR